MKNYRPFLLALAIAGFCSTALAQTPPATTDNPADASATSQSTPPPDPDQPTDTMSSTPPSDQAAPDAPTPAPDPTTDSTTMQTDPPPVTSPVVEEAVVDETVADDDERHGGFPWGLLGLLGLLGLIPRKAKVETYTPVRETTPRTDGYDTTRTP